MNNPSVDIGNENAVQNVTLTDYIRILYRGRWIILFSFIFVFTATVYYTFTTDPVYEASTTLIIDKSRAMENALFDFNSFGNQSTHITNQIEIIKSRTIAERVIKRLELSNVRDSLSLFHPNDDGEYMTLRQMVNIVRENMEVVNKKETDIIEVTYSAPSAFEAAYTVNTLAQEYADASAEFNQGEIKELRKFLEAQLRKKGMELSSSEDLLKEYQERERVASLDEETTELITRLSQIEAELEQSQVMLQANLQMKNSLERQLEGRRETLAAEISEISTPYIKTLQEELAKLVAEKTKFVTAVESQAQGVNKGFFLGQVAQYESKIKSLKQRLDQEAKKLSTSSMVRDPFQLTQELVSRIITLDAEITASTAKINTLQDVVAEYNAKLEQLPNKVLEMARLKRRQLVDEQTFVMMTKRLEETKIQEAGQRKEVRVIDEAIEPLFPTKPKKKLNLALGLVLGLGLGIGITFLREYFDNSIKSQEELEQLGFNILATIPRIEMSKVEEKLEARMSKLGPMEGKRIEARLITHLDPKSPVSEAYRSLRTNIQFSYVDEKIGAVLVTSSGPKEGKSTTSANLVIAMAQSGKKVVLIDADLRRPVVHSIFGLEKDEGLTNYLMDDISFEQMIKPSIMDNLYIIPSGVLPPNPSELLASEKMKALLIKLREEFDFILFDTPPIIAVTDAAILSTIVDGAILVVSSGHTNYDALVRAKSLLDAVNTRILGALLNGVEVGGMYGSYYYYYYHHYYSKPGGKKKRRY
ncbi:MAG TPA: polysaccharide biosynthesis tyrosine autokinase [Caldithrix abyssi]|uniref:non-specific protein-tyrosine kinase n=1 Tax=Caldithrix abyssi TaxID=187145 RepID=A0A7V1M1M2_CALAY|nr:polysaccharide biosynthesis tyrosine autokinase [Caldithrix abyssi]